MVIRISLPHWDVSDAEKRLAADASAPVIVTVPESWCFRITRSSPPGGWSASLRNRLRQGLFPDLAGGSLVWDEDVDEAGTWRVWAIPSDRIDRALGRVRLLVFSGKRKVRVRPSGQGADRLSAFPNLAPPRWRAFRWPWRRIRRVSLLSGPLLALILFAIGFYLHDQRDRQDLDRRLAAAELAYAGEEGRFRSEKQLMEALGNIQAAKDRLPVWLTDLDALTRLLPEDTRLSRIRWSSSVIELEIITPHPQAIQEILEASKNFKEVRFIGRMDRQGPLSRLTLECSRGDGK